MKNKIIISALLFLLCFSFKAYSEEIIFEKGTFSEVLSKAKTSNKVLMIDFFTDWCKWCVELDIKVYTDPQVAGFANENQINWKVDAEKGEGVELAKKYNITGFPTIVFVNGDGEEIDRIVGFLPAKDFLPIMQDYNAGRNTIGSLKKALEKNPDDIESNFRMGKKIADTGDMDGSKVYLQKVVTLDPINSSGWTDDAEFYLAQMNPDMDKALKDFVVKYPDSDLSKQIYIYMAESALQNNDYTTADTYYKDLYAKYGENDEELNFAYGQFLLTKMYAITKKSNATDDDYKNGIKLADECMKFVKGSTNEGSCYFYLSEFYYKLKDKQKALDSINKAIEIRDTKSYQDQKEKISK